MFELYMLLSQLQGWMYYLLSKNAGTVKELLNAASGSS